MTIQEYKEQMCDIGRRIYNRNMVAANDGNFSVRLEDGSFLCTPTGVSKGYLTPEMICHVDGEGNMLEENPPYRPTSEFKMHLRVYSDRPDVGGVVHAHPMYATAFAVCGMALDKPILPEAVLQFGDKVPLAEYALIGSDEVPESIRNIIPHYDALLLENHGALTYSDTLMNAYFKMESLEFYAQVLFNAMQIGKPQSFSNFEMKRLYAVRRALNMPGKHPANRMSR